LIKKTQRDNLPEKNIKMTNEHIKMCSILFIHGNEIFEEMPLYNHYSGLHLKTILNVSKKGE
jgi:hypothetical protein